MNVRLSQLLCDFPIFLLHFSLVQEANIFPCRVKQIATPHVRLRQATTWTDKRLSRDKDNTNLSLNIVNA